MPQSISLNSQNNYEIKIHGQLDDSWQNWFGEAKAHTEVLDIEIEVTAFPNVIMDQAGLVSLIRRLHGLEVVLISIQRIEIEQCPPGD